MMGLIQELHLTNIFLYLPWNKTISKLSTNRFWAKQNIHNGARHNNKVVKNKQQHKQQQHGL